MADTWNVGDVCRVTATWTRPSDGAPLDPDVVKIIVKSPTETTTYQYGVDAVTKTGPGIYRVDVSLTDPGNWYYRCESTGEGQGAWEGQFHVSKSLF